MEKEKTARTRWRDWLNFSAFTLAGVAMEGSATALNHAAQTDEARLRRRKIH
ncbi:hypothetical protein LU196_04840 [Pantoea sp. Mb-10]|uniref:hypothetical protein n=1 Tax=unclassified Pantoea TaxID=2630326 RepID=UPI001E424C67|nr:MULTISPECIES: hypothetical protein [unclassified Pantoea]MCE0489380.1 hypothetical protein [Pantoea sp. Mb-10]MCE0501908.1 hypothetical protein [Pantoea sp. Pb-8]